ncbi:MAG: hypothetical protein A2X23_01320 [Chloroflexi bacterium GWC2_73_18]|nr:MAG: hypothetical protein A2X23_01320 [Chloroflexi bacterium GWC2_73_18]
MEFSDRELWTVLHGMGFGAVFLLAFGGGLAGLWSLRERLLTEEGLRERMPRITLGTTAMAVFGWLTVISGTFIVYPWYRVEPAGGIANYSGPLEGYPKFLLLSSESTAQWHEFGMEWKEHVAWLAPFLATAVAFVVVYYGPQLIRRPELRWPLMIFFGLAFAAAAVAGLFGAFITKAAPVA